MDINEEVKIAVDALQYRQKEMVRDRFGHLSSNWQKLYVIDNLYPLRLTQPPLSDFPMLVDAGVDHWGQISDLDKVVRWMDIYNYLDFLYTSRFDDLNITINTFNELITLLFERGYSGFYCRL